MTVSSDNDVLRDEAPPRDPHHKPPSGPWTPLTVMAARGVFVLACVAAVASAGCARNRDHVGAEGLAAGDHTLTIRHEGRNRAWIVHVPPSARGPLPVVIAYHGGGGEGAGFQEYAALDAIADRESFLVVYPYGTGRLARRLLTWNGGGCCGYAMAHGVDDVSFTLALLDDLADRIPVDTRRVYATGHSNGAIMAYRLAAEAADRIAAIVAVGGAMNLETFAPSSAVPLLHIHSRDDPRALYDGGLGPPFPGTNARSMHAPVEDGLDAWRRVNGCSDESRVEETRSGRAGTRNAGQTATLLVWATCTSGAPVTHWTLTGVGHAWPGSTRTQAREALIGPTTTLLDASTEIWTFVSRHTR